MKKLINLNTKIKIQKFFKAGVHLGHKTHVWNPKMAYYLFGIRNKTHIINLDQSIPLLRRALNVIKEITKHDGKILFLSTRSEFSNIMKLAAKRSNQPYITKRWISGTFTNWKEIYSCIERLKLFEEMQTKNITFSTSELRQFKRLKISFEGLKNLTTLPDLLFILEPNLHSLAIKEALKSNIPIMAILDSNANPDGITYPIPGNDDSLESIHLYCSLISDVILENLKK